MESNKPYCYLYKDLPTKGNLFVSTVVELPANKDLNAPSFAILGNKTTITYTLKTSLGLPAGIRTPSDEQIAWDGTERIVEVVVTDGNNEESTAMNTDNLE